MTILIFSKYDQMTPMKRFSTMNKQAKRNFLRKKKVVASILPTTHGNRVIGIAVSDHLLLQTSGEVDL
jgi:hypothetical protein